MSTSFHPGGIVVLPNEVVLQLLNPDFGTDDVLVRIVHVDGRVEPAWAGRSQSKEWFADMARKYGYLPPF